MSEKQHQRPEAQQRAEGIESLPERQPGSDEAEKVEGGVERSYVSGNFFPDLDKATSK